MLTLRELRGRVDLPEEGTRVPSWKQLEESGSKIVVKEIVGNSQIAVYENGFVIYESRGYMTVFPFPAYGDYSYDAVTGSGEIVPGDAFENENWYIRLFLEGEDHLKRNAERWYEKHTYSYHAACEDWCRMVDMNRSLDDELFAMQEEEEFWNCITAVTPKQRYVLIRYYIYRDSFAQIAAQLGISRQGVRDCFQNALRFLRKRYKDR